ncbi:dehydrogenase/reductase SDR family member 11-like isoform X1 [Schistocerca piceifrons]|uniref:dehydrogenase/reductase SDR family member 11-like isoform X1 n=1 Tax=Schistocerca piceifrons TaxID=274613 RepID=UPI001F5E5057|nr:dehydrogenase/reductase SDR family member 11-like isoform X1 [Schistocerca piceifrons]
MERYRGRVAMVTGASAGIGAAITQALLGEGLTVVGVARRAHRVKELELKDAPGKLHAIEGDVSSEESIMSVFRWIKDNLGGVDVLINNAGVSAEAPPSSGKTEDWKRILDVNVLGLSICTREAVQDMLSRGVDDGFIIHINSLACHLPTFDELYAMYCASKYAVKALLDGLRLDLVARKSNIRVGQISPGVVITEIFDNLTKLSKEAALAMAHLLPEDVAAAAVYMLSQQPRVQVYDIILRPTGSAF